jgi:hypothetical protein
LVYSHANDYDSGPLGAFAKRQKPRDAGLELNVVCGVMLARGASASGIRKLQRIARKA